ncbi:hypothetical protein ABZS66_19310 [Dactylosporangium sp. NPDC005572]|uniref:hypothetical protein n=1 Tax=Dactylosporangium sp. NPDC005572 TaxID=3156889 RepID=UPI0033B7EF46
MTSYREISDYRDDPRVHWEPEELISRTVAYLHDWWDRRNSRYVQAVEDFGAGWEPIGQYYVIRGSNSDDATITDPGDRYNQRLLRFTTADEAIAHVLGAPLQTVLDREEYAAAAASGLPNGAGTECRLVFHEIAAGAWQAVGTVVWQGGFAILHRWSLSSEELLAAGQWAVAHHAVDHAGYPIREETAFLVHATDR